MRDMQHSVPGGYGGHSIPGYGGRVYHGGCTVFPGYVPPPHPGYTIPPSSPGTRAATWSSRLCAGRRCSGLNI